MVSKYWFVGEAVCPKRVPTALTAATLAIATIGLISMVTVIDGEEETIYCYVLDLLMGEII